MSMAIKYGLQKKARMGQAGCAGAECQGCPECTVDQADKPAAVAGSYAEGGDVVDRIMRKRKGEPEADFKPNGFDVMDQIEVHDDANYTGANSGDMLGNEKMDENDRDLISRIMRSRAKKDSMPRPA